MKKRYNGIVTRRDSWLKESEHDTRLVVPGGIMGIISRNRGFRGIGRRTHPVPITSVYGKDGTASILGNHLPEREYHSARAPLGH